MNRCKIRLPRIGPTRTGDLHGINCGAARSRLLIIVGVGALLCGVIRSSTAGFSPICIGKGRAVLAAIIEVLELRLLVAMLLARNASGDGGGDITTIY